MSVDYEQVPLEAVVRNIADVTGAPLQPLWLDDRNDVGLDKEALVTLKAESRPALEILEQALLTVEADATSGGNTWQLTEAGQIEFGPRERLNRTRRLEMYDVADLLLEVRDYSDVPQFDLNSALQAGSGSGGGGGSTSPIQSTQTQNTQDRPEQERADELLRLLTELVEPDQWTANGGSAASARFWRRHFLVTAPDYVHRQLAGYAFWPAERTDITTDASGKRIVRFRPDPSSQPPVVQRSRIDPATTDSTAAPSDARPK